MQTITVTVTNVNDAPVITSDGGGAAAAVSAAENQTAVTDVNATDADVPAQTLTYSISGGADAAAFSIVGATGVLTFTVAPDFENPTDLGDTAGNNTYVVEVTVTDDGAPNLTDVQTITVTVTDVNDPPVINFVNGDVLTYDVGAGALALDQNPPAAATVTDVDSPDFATGTLTVDITAGGDTAEDVLGIPTEALAIGAVQTSGANVQYSSDGLGWTTIGTYTWTPGTGVLQVTLNAASNTTNSAVLIRKITYTNTDIVNPTPTARTVRYTLTDGDGGTSNQPTVTVNMVFGTISITGPATIIEGDFFSVQLGLDNAAARQGLFVQLTYDPLEVEFLDTESDAVTTLGGRVTGTVEWADDNSGTAYVWVIDPLGEPVIAAGTGDILDVRFKARIANLGADVTVTVASATTIVTSGDAVNVAGTPANAVMAVDVKEVVGTSVLNISGAANAREFNWVEIPVVLTYPAALDALFFTVTYDATQVEFLNSQVDAVERNTVGTVAADATISWVDDDAGEVSVWIDKRGVAGEAIAISAGVEIVSLKFRVNLGATLGATGVNIGRTVALPEATPTDSKDIETQTEPYTVTVDTQRIPLDVDENLVDVDGAAVADFVDGLLVYRFLKYRNYLDFIPVVPAATRAALGTDIPSDREIAANIEALGNDLDVDGAGAGVPVADKDGVYVFRYLLFGPGFDTVPAGHTANEATVDGYIDTTAYGAGPNQGLDDRAVDGDPAILATWGTTPAGALAANTTPIVLQLSESLRREVGGALIANFTNATETYITVGGAGAAAYAATVDASKRSVTIVPTGTWGSGAIDVTYSVAANGVQDVVPNVTGQAVVNYSRP